MLSRVSRVLWLFVAIGAVVARISKMRERHVDLNSIYPCSYDTVSAPIQAILCAVESNRWNITLTEEAIRETGCLVGGVNDCITPRHIPTQTEVPPSPPSPKTTSEDYHKLALAAEALVPRAWWRQGYADNQLLLTNSTEDLPTAQMNHSRKHFINNLKLKHMYHCVTSPKFIRTSVDLSDSGEKLNFRALTNPTTTRNHLRHATKKRKSYLQMIWDWWTRVGALFGASTDPSPTTITTPSPTTAPTTPPLTCSVLFPVIHKFYQLWSEHNTTLGGSIHNNIWLPDASTDHHELLRAANDVLTHFYDHNPNTCFRFVDHADCRGALAAAALVGSAHIMKAFQHHHHSTAHNRTYPNTNNLYNSTNSNRTHISPHSVQHNRTHTAHSAHNTHGTLSASKIVRGFLLASLGRSVLHGDNSSTGNTPITAWHLRINDFTALQQVYLKLYGDSYGALYTTQLDTYIPLAFAPSFPVGVDDRWKHLSALQEPVYTSLRNWMHSEANAITDFAPYIPLVALPEVRSYLLQNANTHTNTNTNTNPNPPGRRVLVDVGANGFFASPKYLLDSYAVHAPFTHAYMIEPEPHFSISVPRAYTERYNITFLPIYAEVGTKSETDMLLLLPKLVTKEDFVVLKFDVDTNGSPVGQSMEWGFLFSIMGNPEIAGLVDELYIELHFHFPLITWYHHHSNWEALDAIRYLRANGAIVHAWP